jgi:hypothetical protein
MKHGGAKAAILRVTYFTGGHRRKFGVMINGSVVGKEAFEDKWEDETVTVDYKISPQSLKDASMLEVKFDAEKGFNTGRVAGVHLLRDE